MIQASELRIGNIVKGIYLSEDDDNFVEIECIVLGICENGTYDWPIILKSIQETPYDITEYDRVEGIQITEDILLKCGFVKSFGSDIYYELKYGNLKIICNVLYTEFEISILGYGQKLSGIKYLHQLQNLTHALTSKELTINL